jgi:(p)ppGpp synthase/HD superfamily hydrolase
MIEHCFGQAVAGIVRRLSKVPKAGYVDRLACADWRTLVIKACDRLDNLRSLGKPEVPREFQVKQVRETRDKYFALFGRLAAIGPPETAGRLKWLNEEIRRTTEALDDDLRAMDRG